ncbi:enoyl-CoA hydratase/isomerase family protein [Candidatus Poriferisocius sp.]|uniref:enoyl-CoA hydratase/isomerase family protein n=1 Tax=Candidatus Poriferisocius sp. TaxID=3101276 RepID=UPI003B5B9B07
MASPVEITGLAELEERLRYPYAAEDWGLADCPFVVTRLTSDDLAGRPGDRLAEAIKAVPAVMAVAVPDGGASAGNPRLHHQDSRGQQDRLDQLDVLCRLFDVVVADDPVALPTAVRAAEIEPMAAAAAASPAAAITLVQLLRLSESRSTVEGLVAESLAYSTLQTGPEYQTWLATQRSRPRPDAPEPPVLAERIGSTLYLTLNRPRRHNAFSAPMRDHLVEQLRAAGADPSLDGIVVTGAGPTFCSGGDLAEFGTTPDPGTAHRIRSVRSAAFWMDRLAAKIRVMVHGPCVGAGVELPAYAHDVVAHPDTTFRLPEVAMGLVPGAGGTVSIARRIGRQRLGYLALTNAEIDTTTALSWGLIDRVSPA